MGIDCCYTVIYNDFFEQFSSRVLLKHFEKIQIFLRKLCLGWRCSIIRKWMIFYSNSLEQWITWWEISLLCRAAAIYRLWISCGTQNVAHKSNHRKREDIRKFILAGFFFFFMYIAERKNNWKKLEKINFDYKLNETGNLYLS